MKLQFGCLRWQHSWRFESDCKNVPQTQSEEFRVAYYGSRLLQVERID